MTLIAATLLLLSTGEPVAESPPIAAPAFTASDEQIERLSTREVELWSRMGDRYFGSAEGQAFFRDAGPFRGCEAYNEARRAATGRHYPAFRDKLLGVYRSVLPASVAASARMGYLSPELYSYTGTLKRELDRRTSGVLDAATADISSQLQAWLVRERLQGARLGSNAAGSDFWYNGNHAIIGLVCASPSDELRRQVIGSWFRG